MGMGAGGFAFPPRGVKTSPAGAATWYTAPIAAAFCRIDPLLRGRLGSHLPIDGPHCAVTSPSPPPHTVSFSTLLRCCGFALALLLVATGLASIAAAGDGPDPALLDYLRRRVSERPEDSQSWRLLGSALQQHGDLEGAREALERSLTLEPANAAAHYDLGKLLIRQGEPQLAANRLARVTTLVPDSEYAAQARERLRSLPPPEPESGIALASYEIRRFDGSEVTEELDLDARRALTPLPPVSIRVEAGALYNSNVALSPTNRNFVTDGAGSGQGVLNPSAEIRLLNTEEWRAGPLLTGYFTVNDSDFSRFNLQSYMGGVFVERSLPQETGTLVPRVQYTYTLDQFDGSTFGQRNSLSASLAEINDDLISTVGYASVDHTNLANDGATPSVTSQDGWTTTLGLSHTFWIGQWWLRSTTVGADIQRAQLRGSDYSFNAGTLYGSATIPLTDILDLTFDGGWGYRGYFESTAATSRNQVLWRGGSRLELALTANWKVAGVFTAEAFDSKEPTLNTSRLIGGIVSVYQY